MQYSPGVLILHSTDLVNWTILSHVVPDLTVLDADLNWNKMARAGRGIWAGALRYHRGKFWVYFGTPDQGIYVSSAEHAEGPWSSATLMLNSPGWDDPCPFWDDDGQGYLVATHFAPEGPTRTPYNIHLFKMSPDSDNLLGGFDQIIHQSRGSEANKLYKINGTYYHFYNEVKSEGRVPMIERSRSLLGPWEIHQLAHVQPAIDKEPNQGGLVELLSGKWYFVTHQGRGDWEGRAGVILPVTWIDGWPILGKVGKDGLGNMVWKDTKPIQGFPKTNLFVSDHFDTGSLNPAWEWRYQPRQDGWSLGARQGYLRLFGFPSLRRDDFSSIPDVLTQRSFRTKLSQVTVRLDLGGMTNGQEAGLAHFANAYCTLSVVETNGFRRLSYNSNGTRTMGPRLRGHILYLRSIWDYAGESQFSYSTNGRDYRQFGAPYRLTWGAYRGDRVGLFTVGSLEVGYIDVDWFHYEVQR
jgi:beta-xylosidase